MGEIPTGSRPFLLFYFEEKILSNEGIIPDETRLSLF